MVLSFDQESTLEQLKFEQKKNLMKIKTMNGVTVLKGFIIRGNGI